ncbi:MAG: hypothetical protein CMH60_03835 [Myxococcales bacterium]|nr:hypothetical protein [Myxococcales bacterium]
MTSLHRSYFGNDYPRNFIITSALVLCLNLSVGCNSPDNESQAPINSAEKLSISLKKNSSPQNTSKIYIWQGFKHEWLRRFLGFRIPHRISSLASMIKPEHDKTLFLMGQSTGVDGNHMRPEGFYTVLESDKIHPEYFEIEVQWQDSIQPLPTPKSTSLIQESIILPLQALNQSEDLKENFIALMNGFSLKTKCLQSEESECNSDGIWPYDFSVEIGECIRQTQSLNCPLKINLHRGWTPHHGGIPYLAPKPLNLHTQYKMHVALVVLRGSPMELYTQKVPPLMTEQMLQEPNSSIVPLSLRSKDTTLLNGIIGLQGFAFKLTSTDQLWGAKHQGRYIDKLSAHLESASYSAKTGAMQAKFRTQIGSPKTVRQSLTQTTIHPSLIVLGPSSQNILTNQRVRGTICRNSHNAPFFSRWKRCNKTDLGIEQSEDYVELNARTSTPTLF